MYINAYSSTELKLIDQYDIPSPFSHNSFNDNNSNNNNNKKDNQAYISNFNNSLDYNYLNDTPLAPASSSSTSLNCSSDNVQLLLNITDTVLIVYPWIMMLLGSFSNLVSLIVLTRPKLRKSSTFFYLSCLCIIDLTLLYTFCFNFIFYYQFNIDLQLKHVIICKLYSFLIYFLPQLSAWTCAAVSLDRVIGVIFSVRGKYAAAAKKWNTPNKAFKIIVVIFFFLFLLNVQFFFYPNEYEFVQNELVKDVNIIYCSPENIPRYQAFYINFWVHIDLSVNVLIPFAVMIACSVIIVIGILNSTKNLASKNSKMSKKSTIKSTTLESSRHQSTVRFKQNDQTVSTTEPLSKNTTIRKLKKQPSSSSKARNVSSMLAANNMVFITLTLPIVLFLSFAPAFNEDICDYTKAKLRLVKVVCIILMNMNCSINIFIYSVMASEFRRQLFAIFRELFCCLKSQNELYSSQISNKSTKKVSRQSSDGNDSHSKRANNSR